MRGPIRSQHCQQAPVSPVTGVWACWFLRCISSASHGSRTVSCSWTMGLSAPSPSAASWPLAFPSPGTHPEFPAPGARDAQPRSLRQH